ncbi:MAG TPA: glycogen debranching protein GlgX [Gemmatimonadales bacterium]|nr:glycogen debranching protein GlgX [Gemmatimonadales bacterium]
MHTDDLPGPRAVPGATFSADGTRFVLPAPEATAVELCLFDGETGAERRVALEREGDGRWIAHLPDIAPGSRYGYRVHGPWVPSEGLRFNPAKLLVDPWARAIDGPLLWSDLLLGHLGHRADPEDSAPAVPKAVIVDGRYDWGGDAPPRTPWDRTVIYECHVRGMTMRHPRVPSALRGTFLGLASEPVIEHLLALGVTAVELLPVHHSAIDRHLAHLGLTNYWGYNTIGYFAPDSRFATGHAGEQVTEFKVMVRALHAAGLEVLLDVVYNHTAEGDATGPTLAFRGIDNRGYYRLAPDDRGRYLDFTGVGNTLDAARPAGLALVLESLRYWVTEMHVDGFRFDLATSLGRVAPDFDAAAPFFDAVRRDPVLGAVKLIAEPWDLGPDGYRLGWFPAGWAEWNDRFRDAARRFWTGRADQPGEVARRIGGSADIFTPAGRGPEASVNYVTCHDGFTLRDLVSYEHRHNELNGEDNRDGHHDNLSRNWGVEGPTDDPEIRASRLRASRSLLATLAFSRGIPMLAHGDELGRTQLGNNNAYCHDNPLTWVDWRLGPDEKALYEFTCALFRIRKEWRVLGGTGAHPPSEAGGGVTWLGPDGQPARESDWLDEARSVGMLVDGRPRLLLLMNGGEEPRRFVLPPAGRWKVLIAAEDAGVEGHGIEVREHGFVLLAEEA